MLVLTRLFIQNYAIIDQLEIEFSNGFSAITGETGAGKSIIIGALGLILGQRADSSVLVNKERKLVVEGVFKTPAEKAVIEFLKTQELEQEDELVLRREIAVNGKSRAFVNDSPVNLVQLQLLASMLVDLHQQFDTLELSESDFQRSVLDALAGQQHLLEEYQQGYQLLLQTKAELTTLQETKRQFDAVADYNRFQYEELEQASFKPGELEALDEELKLLSNAEGIRLMLEKSTTLLSLGEETVLAKLKGMLNEISHYRELHKELPALLDRMRSSYVELQDLAAEFEKLSASVSMDPERMEFVNDRLSMGYRLCKKHQVTTTDELLHIQDNLATQLQSVLDIDQTIREK